MPKFRKQKKKKRAEQNALEDIGSEWSMITAPPEATTQKVSGTTGRMCTDDMVKRCLRKPIRSYPFKPSRVRDPDDPSTWVPLPSPTDTDDAPEVLEWRDPPEGWAESERGQRTRQAIQATLQYMRERAASPGDTEGEGAIGPSGAGKRKACASEESDAAGADDDRKPAAKRVATSAASFTGDTDERETIARRESPRATQETKGHEKRER